MLQFIVYRLFSATRQLILQEVRDMIHMTPTERGDVATIVDQLVVARGGG